MAGSSPSGGNTLPRNARVAFTIVLAIYGFVVAKNVGTWSLMDNIDLPIHETGHLVFAPFGEFVGFAGGTLFQLIVPSVFVGYFLKQRDQHSASVALWWVAQNFWNISVYAADARVQELPLVGGGEHDWTYMLGRLGWLRYDHRVARIFFGTGVLLFLAAITWGFIAAMNLPVREETT